MQEKLLLEAEDITRITTRLSYEIIEKNKDLSQVILVGIKTRGIYLANRLQKRIERLHGTTLPVETLDIHFYRDDLEKVDHAPTVQQSNFQQSLTGKTVIIVDDVLFTGRTVRAAMDAILDVSRPQAIRLAILVDRGHRELPIRADYVGKNIPTALSENVKVFLQEIDQEDKVSILS